MNFNFPRARFVDENTAGQQLDHAMSEVEEIRVAAEDESVSFEDLTMEIADLTHSLETYWRIMEKVRGKAFVRSVFKAVEKKNQVRGYY